MRKSGLALVILFVMVGCHKNDCVNEDLIQDGPCTKILLPVCGCDGKTYGNECLAKNAGVTDYERGECEN